MRLPLRLDVSLLTVLDADSNVVCRADVSQSDRVNAEAARELRELVIARNFTRYLSPEAMAGKGALTINVPGYLLESHVAVAVANAEIRVVLPTHESLAEWMRAKDGKLEPNE